MAVLSAFHSPPDTCNAPKPLGVGSLTTLWGGGKVNGGSEEASNMFDRMRLSNLVLMQRPLEWAMGHLKNASVIL